MSLTSKIFGEKKTGLTEGYIDLEKYSESTTSKTTSAKMHIAIGEIQQYEDIKALSDYVCGGNILVLDFTPVCDEEVILKRITNDFKKIAQDIGGDIAGIGNNLMIITPKDVAVDRRKIRGKFS